MSTPLLGPDHHRLAALAGRWQGEEQLAASPWAAAGTAVARLELRVVAGGFALVQDYAQEQGGLSGHGVFSVVPGTAVVLWHWFDSLGYPPLEPARGAWRGDELRLERTTPRGTNRTTFTLDGDELGQRIELRGVEEQRFRSLVDGHYVRAAGV